MVANRKYKIDSSETGLVKFIYSNRHDADNACDNKINDAEAREIILEMGWVANEETLPINLMMRYQFIANCYHIIYDVRNLMSRKS